MKTRLHLIWLMLRRSPLMGVLPILVSFAVLPAITTMKYLSAGMDNAYQSFLYASQAFLPLGSMFWPMAYLHIWVSGNGCEVLRSCRQYHKSCCGEIALLYTAYIILLLPPFAFLNILIGPSWKEFIRVSTQSCLVISALYFCIIVFRNVTIGSIPVFSYLFFCFFIAGSADFSRYSILNPYILEDPGWKMALFIIIGFLFLFAGMIVDRQWNKIFLRKR